MWWPDLSDFSIFVAKSRPRYEPSSLIIMLIIGGCYQRVSRLSKRVVDYYADNQRHAVHRVTVYRVVHPIETYKEPAINYSPLMDSKYDIVPSRISKLVLANGSFF